MAPPSPRHSAITGRLARLIGNALKAPCEVFVEAGIVTPARADTYLQADLAVSCRPLEQQDRDVAEPILVVEVESPGTVRHDRGVKVDRYRELPSVQEILLVASTERRVQLWRRESGRWSVEDVIGDALLRLESCALEIPLADLYAGL
jgi:Uma2 family endonuclease